MDKMGKLEFFSLKNRSRHVLRTTRDNKEGKSAEGSEGMEAAAAAATGQ